MLAYMAGLFALSSVSNPPALPGEPSDKLVHAVLYAGLGSVCLRAVVDRRWSRITARRVLDAVLMAVAYGAFDEFHQSLVAGRRSDFADLMADGIGAVTAAVALWLWGILWVKKTEGISNIEHRTSNTSSENLLVERDGAIAVLTINRPKSLNALNRQTLRELDQALAQLAGDAGVRSIIITGAGDRAFIAGADVNELALLTPSTAPALALAGQQVFSAIETMGKPVIAAINGFALGGGCELAMACTVRIAADTARLGQPEINLGIIPGYAGTQRLARLVGKGKAMELILTGMHIPADEALRIGLVNRVVPAAALMMQARALAAELAAKPALALRYCIDAINQGLEMSFAEGCQHEAALFGLVTATEDMREGTKAFLEKRKPEFKGK